MGSIVLKRGSKQHFTPEQIAELNALNDREIDFSDIPAPKDGESRKWYRVNPRTPEEWEQYYKNCPPHIQKRYEKLRKLYGPII